MKNAPMYGFRAMQVYDPDDEWADKVLAEARRVRKLEEGQTGK